MVTSGRGPNPEDNDTVPAPWNMVLNNEEWLIHGIVVRASWAFLVVAIIAHVLAYIWRPWF